MTKENFNLPEGKQYGNEFLSNHKKIMIFTKISTWSPLIIFPLLAFYYGDWWLLLGIFFSSIGAFFSANPLNIIIILVLTISYSLIFGFLLNSYPNIFFLSYAYGHFTYSFVRYFEKKLGETKSKIKNQADQMYKTVKQNV